MKLGIIADDYTGGTDAASFIASAGLRCVQLNGVPNPDETAKLTKDIDGIVVSLKSRSAPKQQAVNDSLAAYRWLKAQGCTQIQFKYCSTFDSTSDGNIGPVTDALLSESGLDATIICPALPINGRHVFFGNLFVNSEPLNESGLKDHPLTPMRDANVLRLMNGQSNGVSALIDFQLIEQGSAAVQKRFKRLADQGYRYIVVDAFNERHLDILGDAFCRLPLVTGGSGITSGLTKHYPPQELSAETNLIPKAGKTVVISGSCSVMTNKQVRRYEKLAPSLKLDLEEVLNNDNYPQQLAEWVAENSADRYAPIVSATVDVTELSTIRDRYPLNISSQIEQLFAQLVIALNKRGYRNFIAAGGETSGAVTQALNANVLEVGQLIDAGVPWVRVMNSNCHLALKSGNFGHVDFFQQAQDLYLPNLRESN